ncbi:ATP-binding cassette domain-containing protein [Risungbinella massiliensis]|uniref:ATP-binding cassette domain-containing protein n=1 Tax=Risungbinella massiliensis TaxID=1329796 RepID=UPI0005CC2CD6|nr:ABC transporter ATP-binding protein [Risungbinella massiliensis]
MSNFVAELNGVTKSYKFWNKAIEDQSFQIPYSGMVGLIGSNASGKTTLLHLLAGLTKPSKGEVYVAGQKMDYKNLHQVAFFAAEYPFYPFMTIEETLRYANGIYPDFSYEKAEQMRKDLGWNPSFRVKDLSRGNKELLKVLIGLCRRVPLLLFDEPLSGLDPIARKHIMKLFAKYAEVEEQTIILSYHELYEIDSYLDYVIVLKNGRVEKTGWVEDIREEEGKGLMDILMEVAQ